MANRPYPEQPDLHTKAEHRAAVLTYPANLQEAVRQAQADPKKTLFGVAQGIPSTFATKVGCLVARTGLLALRLTRRRFTPRRNRTSSGWTWNMASSTAPHSTSTLNPSRSAGKS